MRCPFATWQGSPNESPGRMGNIMGVVFHIEQGYESGTEAVFHNPAYQASAHFGCAKNGALDQFVDTNDMAWAEADGNPNWFSIEHEGFSGDSLTPQQIATDARLTAWLLGHEGGPGYKFPLTITDTVDAPGIGWHGMGGAAWGGHYDCPGGPIKAQRLTVIQVTNGLLGVSPAPAVPDPSTGGIVDFVGFARTPSGKGYFQVKSDGAVFAEGDAVFRGGANDPARPLAKPASGIACHPSFPDSYWICAQDGGVFTYGPHATFKGSEGGVAIAAPVVGIEVTPTGNGYWLYDAKGGVASYGDAAFEGSEFGK